MTTPSSSKGTQPRIDTVQSHHQVWLADLTYTQQTVSADLIPAAIGRIALYTEKYVDFEDSIQIFKYPEDLAKSLDSGRLPEIIGFSCYIWNSSLSLAFASYIKSISPSTTVVFGGPHFPTDETQQNSWLLDNRCIDFFIEKEGELAFKDLVLAYLDNSGDHEAMHGKISSVHSIDSKNIPRHSPITDRIRNLDDIPSPYLEGRMDKFFDGNLLPIIQTNRGCPFTCTFCIEGVGYYNKINRNSAERISNEIMYIGGMMQESRKKGGRNDLFIADSNFGMYKEDISTCEAIRDAKMHFEWPEYINVATGKNNKERVLSAAKLLGGSLRLSGSVQSLDPNVLKNIKRNNIAPDKLLDLALQASEVGANSYSEIILGLPGDSKKAHFNTLKQVIEAGFNYISPYQLMLLPGSEMDHVETRTKYGMDTRFRIFPRCYGWYNVGNTEIVSAEVEEVCVALDSLPFDDYLACRKLHLFTTIFFNDDLLGGIRRFLRSIGLSVFRWLEILSETEPPNQLKNLVDKFLEETRDELWLHRNDLERSIRDKSVIQDYIDGRKGNNLLFTYKAIALTQMPEVLGQHVVNATNKLLIENKSHSEEHQEYISDAVSFHVTQMKDMLEIDAGDPEIEVRYDMLSIIKSGRTFGELTHYRQPKQYRFVLTEHQKDSLIRNQKVFGTEPWSVGRMFTKVYVKKMLRSVVEI
jgi:radical SAM superfamily enzyme YgiQ (UPF0313 family)